MLQQIEERIIKEAGCDYKDIEIYTEKTQKYPTTMKPSNTKINTNTNTTTKPSNTNIWFFPPAWRLDFYTSPDQRLVSFFDYE